MSESYLGRYARERILVTGGAGAIGGNLSRHRTDPWIARYLFPNSKLPQKHSW